MSETKEIVEFILTKIKSREFWLSVWEYIVNIWNSMAVWEIVIVIIGVLFLFGFILLLHSVKIYVEYNGHGNSNDFSAKVKYLAFTVYDYKKDQKKKLKKEKKLKKLKKKKPKKYNAKKTKAEKKKDNTFIERLKKDVGVNKLVSDVKGGGSQKNSTKSSTNSLASFDFGIFKLMYDSVKQPIRRLIRKLKVRKLHIDYVIGGDDAARTAISYGLQSAAISAFLAWANEIVNLKVKKVNVNADFSKKETDLYMKCFVKLRVMSMAIFALQYIINANKTINN
jgi:ribosomal protein S9